MSQLDDNFLLNRRSAGASNMAAADAGLMREKPQREIRVGIIAIAGFLALFGGWGALARLGAGVTAQGEVVVYGNRQAVQHRDGGIVRDLNVHEGDHVHAGQILLQLADGEPAANARSVSNQIIEQKALQARLTAEMSSARSISFPAEFTTFSGDDRVAAAQAMRLEQLEFSRRAAALGTERGVLSKQADQASEQIRGYDNELEANRRQHTLIGQEFDGLKQIYQQGLVPDTRMRQLQRNQAELDGSAAQYGADRARTEQEVGEKHIRMQDLVAERDADDAKEFRGAEQQLGELEPKLVALREQIARTVIRAPATGQIVNLSAFTVGGVVAPGQKLMEIVPDNEPLVVMAKIKPSDAEDLKIGQSTEVRISAFHDRRMPLLHGIVQTISADALNEEKSGQSYYRVDIVLPPSELAAIRRVRGADAALKPGLPVEVVVPLKARSALEYLSGPLSETLWSGFRQH